MLKCFLYSFCQYKVWFYTTWLKCHPLMIKLFSPDLTRISQSMRARMVVAPTAGIWWMLSWDKTETLTPGSCCLASSPGHSTLCLWRPSHLWWRTNMYPVPKARSSTSAHVLQVNMTSWYVTKVTGKDLLLLGFQTDGMIVLWCFCGYSPTML